MAITVIINGESHELPEPVSADKLLAHLDIDAKKVALERNLQIIPKSMYDNAVINEGDRIEIVHFIGGG